MTVFERSPAAETFCFGCAFKLTAKLPNFEKKIYVFFFFNSYDLPLGLVGGCSFGSITKRRGDVVFWPTMSRFFRLSIEKKADSNKKLSLGLQF